MNELLKCWSGAFTCSFTAAHQFHGDQGAMSFQSQSDGLCRKIRQDQKDWDLQGFQSAVQSWQGCPLNNSPNTVNFSYLHYNKIQHG